MPPITSEGAKDECVSIPKLGRVGGGGGGVDFESQLAGNALEIW